MKTYSYLKLIFLGAVTLALGGCYLEGSVPVQITPAGSAFLNLSESAGTISYSQLDQKNCAFQDHRLTCVRGEIKIVDGPGAQLMLFQVTSICESSDETVYGDYYLPGKLVTCTATGTYKNQPVNFTGRFAQIALPFPMVSMIEGTLLNQSGEVLVTQVGK